MEFRRSRLTLRQLSASAVSLGCLRSLCHDADRRDTVAIGFDPSRFGCRFGLCLRLPSRLKADKRPEIASLVLGVTVPATVSPIHYF